MITYTVIIATDPKDGQLGVSLKTGGFAHSRQESIVSEFFRTVLERATAKLSETLLEAGELDGAMTMTGETARRAGDEFERRVKV